MIGKRSALIAAAVTTVGVASFAGAGLVSADALQGSATHQSLVDKIADKFHLNRSEVQAVFDENRVEHQDERQARVQDRLDALVKDGTITQSQKTAIEAKLVSLQQERESSRGKMQEMSADERRQHMQQQRADLEAWANDQGLNLRELRGIFMPGHGMHGHHGPHDMDNDE